MPTEAPPAAIPSATVREVTIVDSGPPKPPPAPTREIKVSDLANLPGEKRPGAETSSRQSLQSKLASKAKPSGNGPITPTPVTRPKETTTEKPPVEEEATEEGAEEQTTQTETAAAKSAKTETQEIDPATGKPKRPNPWKLYETEKAERAKAEAEVQRLKTSIVPEQERTSLTARVDKAEKRNAELEDEIRFRAYEKSTEFKEKYQDPYEAAWKRATTEISEISITDPVSRQPRGVTSEDILELINMPLGKAREIADDVFGKFADDVMAHRKEIKGLFEKQTNALEEARKNGGTREKQRQEQYQKQQAETQAFVKNTWDQANQEFLADKVNGEFFKPKVIAEGQQPTPEEKEWNDALDRGFKLVDEAWGSDYRAPGLTNEQRQEIIKKNAAVRNRAAAFGPMKKLNTRLKAQVAALQKELEQYSESTPEAGGSKAAATPRTSKGGMEGFRTKLRSIATK